MEEKLDLLLGFYGSHFNVVESYQEKKFGSKVLEVKVYSKTNFK